MLQMRHMVVDNSAKDSPAVVGNSGMGRTKVALEVAGNHTVVGLHIEFEHQAGFDKKFGIELQPAFEDQMGFGVPLGATDRIEKCQ